MKEITDERNKLSGNIMEYMKENHGFRGEDGYGRTHISRFIGSCGGESHEIFKGIVKAIPFLPDKLRPLTLELLSLACGVLLAFQSGINALELLDVKIANPLIGIGITGLVIGKGSNFAHDFFHSFKK